MNDATLPSRAPTDWSHLLPRTVFAVSVIALATAYIAEYGFALKPCNLCLWQRVPYFVSGALALAVLGMAPGALRTVFLWLCAAAFAAGGVIAVHHIGVEQHWWGSVASCGGQLPIGMDTNDLMAALSAPPDPACDAPNWVMFGISAATYNAALSLGLAVFTVYGLMRIRRSAR